MGQFLLKALLPAVDSGDGSDKASVHCGWLFCVWNLPVCRAGPCISGDLGFKKNYAIQSSYICSVPAATHIMCSLHRKMEGITDAVDANHIITCWAKVISTYQ